MEDLNTILLEKFVILFFSNKWSFDIPRVRAELITLADKFRNVRFLEIEKEKNYDIISKYYISSYPTVIYFRNGKEQVRLTEQKTYSEYKTVIQDILEVLY